MALPRYLWHVGMRALWNQGRCKDATTEQLKGRDSEVFFEGIGLMEKKVFKFIGSF